MRHLCTWLALLVGFGVVLNAVPSRAADKADADTIKKWIGKLSSGRFAEREKAQKELEKIGLPAFDALRKAADKGDPEARRRAGELVAKMEKQVLAAKVLAPRRLHLTYKDTPVKEAVADFAKKSGYNISLHDPKKTLRDRKLTLDTGETTFWQAFDQFCAKANLTEATQQDLGQPMPFPPRGVPLPGGILPVVPPGKPVPLPPLRIQPGLPGKTAPALPPVKRQALRQQTEQFQFVLAQQSETKPAQAPALKGKAAAVPAQAPAPAQPPAIQILPAQVQPGVWRGGPMRRWPLMQPGQIVLKDGKEKALPTAYVGAVRVRLLDNPAPILGAAPQGEMLLGLQVSLEPKIRWQNLLAVRIDKALDDQDQKLTPGMGGAPGVRPGFGGQPRFGGGFGGRGMAVQPWGGWNTSLAGGGMHHYVPVRLKKGDKASKSLKELSGSITATLLAEPETLLSADGILKAAGKTFKGKKDGGAIKVNGVEENNGLLRLRVELEQPANVVPANQGNAGVIGVFNGPVGGPMILPIAPPPVPAPLPPAKPRLKGAFQQIQFKPAQVQAAPAQIQIQVQVGGGGVIQIGGGPAVFGGSNTNGLELLDDKGNVIPNAGVGMMGRGGPGGVFTMEYHLTFRLQKGQKPAKLVFKGSKRVNVEIPFSLKNVQLP